MYRQAPLGRTKTKRLGPECRLLHLPSVHEAEERTSGAAELRSAEQVRESETILAEPTQPVRLGTQALGCDQFCCKAESCFDLRHNCPELASSQRSLARVEKSAFPLIDSVWSLSARAARVEP